MRRELRLALAVLVAGVGSAEAGPAEVLRFAECPTTAREYAVELASEVRLVRAFLEPTGAVEAQVREAALHQLKYLWGYLRTDERSRRRQQLTLSAEAATVEIKGLREVPYGRALALPWRDTKELVIEDPYTRRAVARGQTRADDPALLAAVTVRFKVIRCAAAEPPGGRLLVPLPDDPWLLYWHVPAAEHRLLRYHEESAVTNPCNDDDFADLPHPYYHWYDWQPARHGADAAGRPFDCRALLHEGVDFFPRTARFSPLPTAGPDLSRLRRGLAGADPLRATVLIGVLDHAFPDLDLEGLRRQLGAGADPAPVARRLLAAPILRERGARRLLRLLDQLGALAEVAAYATRLDGDYLVVAIEGRLRRSRRPLRLEVAYGVSDVFGPVPPQHWAIARRALQHDHLVVYAGHSGIGENWRLARIAKGLALDERALAEEIAGAPFQLVAFLSCYSYMYFGQDLVQGEAQRREPRREFVFTGSPFTDGDRGTLAVLDFTDRVLAGAPLGGPAPLRFVSPEDFLIVKGFR